MSEEDAHYKEGKTEKLRVFSSPLTDPARGRGVHQYALPEFKRYNEPTLLEIFFDLFFAAAYTTFCDVKKVTNQETFKASIGFFCLLWLTWFAVTLFDVRFTSDSIFARLTRAVQLGVLVGFVVVAPKFDPSTQNFMTMRAMSFILAISRACLAIEYSSILGYVRSYKKARLPLFLQVALHTISALIYLGIAFHFTPDSKSRAFMTWYFISGAEAITSLLLSNLSPVLSLTDTHLMKRLALLTVMIIGEGIEAMAKQVVTIVKNPDAWDVTTIGEVTAAAATIYFVFLVYFDWLRSSYRLPPLWQQLWTSFHFPFHLALVLFMQGFTQFLIWSKIVRQVLKALDLADPTDDISNITTNITSLTVTEILNQSAQAVFHDYPPKSSSILTTANEALKNISNIPETFWPLIIDYLNSANSSSDDSDPGISTGLTTLLDNASALAASMANAIFGAFGINIEGSVVANNPGGTESGSGASFQFAVQDRNWAIYSLVFVYGYIAGGCTILLMVILRLLTRNVSFKVWPVIRLVSIILLALGTGLVSLLWYNQDRMYGFLLTPWVLPTMTLVWTVILVITHINGEGTKWTFDRFIRRRRDRG